MSFLLSFTRSVIGFAMVQLAYCEPAHSMVTGDLTTIGGHYCKVFNSDAPHVIVLFHGYLNDPSDYFPLAERFSQAGYVVVVPLDLTKVDALAKAATWGKDLSAAVRDFAYGRKVAVVGHSLGGAAAMAAAKFTPGLSAYIAMHPAPIASGVPWAQVNGPILFTTGTYDDGTFADATAPDRALQSYNDALVPKALVNVKGDDHVSSIKASGLQWAAIMSWLGCFTKELTRDCEWLQQEMCSDPSLEWCYHYGIRADVLKKRAVHV
jgi:dienelactone hydrolase